MALLVFGHGIPPDFVVNAEEVKKLTGQNSQYLATPDEIEELKRFFEFDYCDECHGDYYDHDIIMILGNPFYLCKIATNPDHQIRAREQN